MSERLEYAKSRLDKVIIDLDLKHHVDVSETLTELHKAESSDALKNDDLKHAEYIEGLHDYLILRYWIGAEEVNFASFLSATREYPNEFLSRAHNGTHRAATSTVVEPVDASNDSVDSVPDSIVVDDTNDVESAEVAEESRAANPVEASSVEAETDENSLYLDADQDQAEDSAEEDKVDDVDLSTGKEADEYPAILAEDEAPSLSTGKVEDEPAEGTADAEGDSVDVADEATVDEKAVVENDDTFEEAEKVDEKDASEDTPHVTAASINDIDFPLERKGYVKDQVDSALDSFSKAFEYLEGRDSLSEEDKKSVVDMMEQIDDLSFKTTGFGKGYSKEGVQNFLAATKNTLHGML